MGSILVAAGCLGILALAFGAGFYSGRYWTRASTVAADAEAAPSAASGPPVRSGPRGGSAPPALTFYEELTAPLAPPPAPTPAKPASPAPPRPAAEKAERPTNRPPEERTARSPETPPRRSEPAVPAERPAAGGRFTVQIAAYSARASAEALRNSVSASGHEAYIVESEGPPGAPRYRVRVGSYASREAALAAASRLPVPGPRYVTTR
jgi:DedD protein